MQSLVYRQLSQALEELSAAFVIKVDLNLPPYLRRTSGDMMQCWRSCSGIKIAGHGAAKCRRDLSSIRTLLAKVQSPHGLACGLWRAVNAINCNAMKCEGFQDRRNCLNQTGDMKQGQGVDTIRVQRTDNKQHLAFSL